MGLGGVGFLGVDVREVFAVPPVPLQLSPLVLWGVCEPERSDGSRSEGPGLIMQESPPVASLVWNTQRERNIKPYDPDIYHVMNKFGWRGR